MFQACSQAGPLPNLTHDWSAPPWAHTNSSFEHLPGEVILELGEAQVTERRTQSPMRACGCRSRRPAPTVTRSPVGLRGLFLGTRLRAPAGHLLPRLLPTSVGDDGAYEYDVDTSRLVPSCLEHSGRLGPLACQVEIFLTLSGIYRYLGRLN